MHGVQWAGPRGLPRGRTTALGLALVAATWATACGDPTGPADARTSALVVGARHGCRLAEAVTQCWGRGDAGQLGRAELPAEPQPPTAVEGAPAEGFVALAAGRSHTCGLTAAGVAWCWGAGESGQLGLGAPPGERCTPVICARRPAAVAGTHVFRALAAGAAFTCGLAADGRVWCWGIDDVGQLGTRDAPDTCSSLACAHTPVLAAEGRAFVSLSAGLAHVCALAADGQVWCWGYNYQGQLGRGDRTDTPVAAPVHGSARFRQVSAGGLHSCAVDRDGRGWCWGIDAVGAGPQDIDREEPTRVAGDLRFREIRSARFTSCGIVEAGAQAGRVACWGANEFGELGRATPTAPPRLDVPTLIESTLTFRTLHAGSATYCGATTDETTVCWGRGTSGELGSGSGNSTAPVPLPPS
jgi:alpha-tubulin suppressor-like RCC1 family protein